MPKNLTRGMLIGVNLDVMDAYLIGEDQLETVHLVFVNDKGGACITVCYLVGT